MGAGWTLIFLAVVLSALLLTAGLASVPLRRGSAERWGPGAEPLREAERVLADRFARGELETEEYEQRLRTLRAGRR